MRTRWLALAGVAVAALLVAPDTARSFDDRRHPRGPQREDADVPRAGPDVPRADRGLRQEGAGAQRHRRHQPDALKLADTLDARFAQSGPVGPLHCVPLIVKDNYETTDMSTSAGSLSLKGVMSKTD